MTLRRTKGADIDDGPDGENYLASEVIEDDLNPWHQGFVGFIPPSDGPMTPIEKSARRLAAELVITPRSMRPKSDYTEAYLKKVSQCRLWPRITCAHCNCWKKDKTV